MIQIDLSGQTALVTGASQGLGKATATLLHSAGANVVVNFLDDPEGANRKLAEELVAGFGHRGVAVSADVRDAGAVQSMMKQTIARFGSLDTVVNNAGIIRDSSLKKMSPEAWQQVIDTNLTGVFNVCQQAGLVLADGGSMLNLASISAVLGFFGQANYAAAKAGVIGLTKVLSKELAKRQIRVNAVAPGVVLTEMGKSIPEEVRQEMLGQIPLGRFGEPEEISKVILFLCSDLASYITGQTIHVNGGWWA